MNKTNNTNHQNGKFIAMGHAINWHPFLKFFALCSLCLLASSCAVQPGQHVPAFLPMADSVPARESMDIDGVWRVSTIGKNIRIEGGRAYAIDSWLHLFTLEVKPNMVVIRNIISDGMGGYTGEDLPLMGKWQAKLASDGALDVQVAGALGPAYYRLLPVETDSPNYDGGDEDDDYPDAGQEDGEPDYREPPSPVISPIDGARLVGNSVADVGKRCYRDFEPMGKAMLKYRACQMVLGNLNALKKALTARNAEDAKGILAAKGCINEFNELVDTVRRKGFKSISLGVGGELGAIIGGSGEAFIASNLDLSRSTIYGSLGAGIGSQVGGGLNGVVTAFYDNADQLSGKGKSFSVS
ncbi:MAG: hypothetical protein ACU85E_16330, partial [Gammaproteobacteria bacterium]